MFVVNVQFANHSCDLSHCFLLSECKKKKEKKKTHLKQHLNSICFCHFMLLKQDVVVTVCYIEGRDSSE